MKHQISFILKEYETVVYLYLSHNNGRHYICYDITDNIRNLQGVFAVPISEKKLKELADGNIDIYSIFADRSEELTFSHCGIERKADFKEMERILPKPGVKLKWFGSHRKKFEKYMEGFNE